MTNRPLNITLLKIFRKYENIENPPPKLSKTPILEFLEGSLCGMVDTLSWKNDENFWRPAWNYHSDDI